MYIQIHNILVVGYFKRYCLHKTPLKHSDQFQMRRCSGADHAFVGHLKELLGLAGWWKLVNNHCEKRVKHQGQKRQ